MPDRPHLTYIQLFYLSLISAHLIVLQACLSQPVNHLTSPHQTTPLPQSIHPSIHPFPPQYQQRSPNIYINPSTNQLFIQAKPIKVDQNQELKVSYLSFRFLSFHCGTVWKEIRNMSSSVPIVIMGILTLFACRPICGADV